MFEPSFDAYKDKFFTDTYVCVIENSTLPYFYYFDKIAYPEYSLRKFQKYIPM